MPDAEQQRLRRRLRSAVSLRLKRRETQEKDYTKVGRREWRSERSEVAT